MVCTIYREPTWRAPQLTLHFEGMPFVIRKLDLSSWNFGLTLLEALLARSMVVFKEAVQDVSESFPRRVFVQCMLHTVALAVLLKSGHVQWLSSSHSSG